jgi:hypothetical protein
MMGSQGSQVQQEQSDWRLALIMPNMAKWWFSLTIMVEFHQLNM